MAAAMQGLATSEGYTSVVEGMDCSNAAALPILKRADLGGLTDVTGFGLAGHLGEMLRGAGLGAKVEIARVPLYPRGGRIHA